MGELLALAAGVCFSLATMLAQRGMKEASAAAGVFVGLVFNNIIYALLLGSQIWVQGVPNVTGEGFLYAVGGGLAGNVLGRTLQFSGVRRIGSARTLSLSLTQTLFAFIFSVFLLKEMPDHLTFMGIVIIVGGVYLLTKEQITKEKTRTFDKVLLKSDGPTNGQEETAVTKKLQLLSPPVAGVIFALLSGLAYSVADLSRKLSLRSLPSPILTSAIGGISALLVHSITIGMRGGWQEITGLKRQSLFFLIGSGMINGLAVVLLNTAFGYASLVVVNSLYNIRVWVPIVLGPLILGTEARINKIVVASTAMILAGTLIITMHKYVLRLKWLK